MTASGEAGADSAPTFIQTLECEKCGQAVDAAVDSCPHCGIEFEPVTTRFRKVESAESVRPMIAVGATILVAGICAALWLMGTTEIDYHRWQVLLYQRGGGTNRNLPGIGFGEDRPAKASAPQAVVVPVSWNSIISELGRIPGVDSVSVAIGSKEQTVTVNIFGKEKTIVPEEMCKRIAGEVPGLLPFAPNTIRFMLNSPHSTEVVFTRTI